MKALLLILMLFISCDKSEKYKKETVELFLTSFKWKLVKIVQYGYGSPFTYSRSECEKDNYIRFKINGDLEYHNGSIQCDPKESEVERHHWSLEGDKFPFDLLGDGWPDQLIKIDYNELIIEYPSDPAGYRIATYESIK